ncbi:MAG: hypothetical protein AAGD06_16000 [Acidobacteriota bacterium]
MSTRPTTFVWILMLALLPAFAWGHGGDTEPTVESEVQERHLSEAVSEAPQIEEVAMTGTAPESGVRCTCDCVCPTSGAFETQTFLAPKWIAGCGQFNGDECSIGIADTCNTFRVYQNCS